jgi:hypothetical protein
MSARGGTMRSWTAKALWMALAGGNGPDSSGLVKLC